MGSVHYCLFSPFYVPSARSYVRTYVRMWLSPKILYPASPPPSRPNRRSPALRRRPAVIQPTFSGNRGVPAHPFRRRALPQTTHIERTAVVCPPPKGCPQVAAYAALPAHENLQYDIPPHTSLPSPTHPFSNQLCGASAPTPGGFPSRRPPYREGGEGESGDGGTGDTASAGT